MALSFLGRVSSAGGRWAVGRAGLLGICLALGSGGCRQNMEPASYVTGLRVLAITAQPPQVPPGQTAALSALVVDTQGRPLRIAWSQCLAAPLQGQAVNPDCLTGADNGSLQALGSGPQIAVTMPTTAPSVQALGLPDATGGLYLPLVVAATVDGDSLVATYGLRVNLTGEPANQNPRLTDVYTVVPGSGGADAGSADSGEVLTAIDPATPLPVHAGDVLTLRVTFAPGSAESYQIPGSSSTGSPMPRTVTETLNVAYFATAGSLSGGTSGVERPDRILTLDSAHLPASGTAIDLWVIGRDERGGTDYLHRTLVLQ